MKIKNPYEDEFCLKSLKVLGQMQITTTKEILEKVI